MFNYILKSKTLFFIAIILLCSACGKEDPIDPTTSNDKVMTWTANDVDFESLTEEVFGINVNGLFILGEDASEWGIYMDLGTGPVTAGRVYNLGQDSNMEMRLYDNRTSEWSSIHPGGSGQVTITSYEVVEDDFFVDAIAKGVFSGTLTTPSDTTVCNVTNGVFTIEL